MAGAAFRVGVSIALTGNMLTGLGAIGRGIANVSTLTSGLNAQLRGLETRMVAGAAVIGVGAGMLSFWSKSVSGAAQLQQQMFLLQTTTRASNKEMNSFLGTALEWSNKTMFSLTQMTGIANQIREMGITNIKQIQSMMPWVSQMAEILNLTRGVPVQQSVQYGVGMSRLMGAYTPQQQQEAMQLLTRFAVATPSTPTRTLTQASYAAPMMINVLGVKPEDMLAVLLANQLMMPGAGGARGPLSGAQLSNIMVRQFPGVFGSGLLKGKSTEALAALGITQGGLNRFVRIDPNTGKPVFDLMGFVAQIGAASQGAERAKGYTALLERYKRAGGDPKWVAQMEKAGPAQLPAVLSTLYQQGFGVAGRGAAIMGTHGWQGLVTQSKDWLTKNLTIQQMQNLLMQTALDQWNRLTTNHENVNTLLSYSSLPRLTEFTAKLGDLAQRIATWEFRNPAATMQLSTGIFAAGAGFLGTGGYMVLTSLMRLFGMISAAAGPLAVIGALIKFFTITGVVSAGIYLLVTHWSELAKLLSGYPKINAILTDPLGALGKVMRTVSAVVAELTANWAYWLKAQGLGGPLDIAKKALADFFDKLPARVEALEKRLTPAPDPRLAPGWRPPHVGDLVPPSKHPALYRPPGAPGAIHVHGGTITVSVSVPGAGDPKRVAEMVADEFAHRFHVGLISTTRGGGIYESDAFHRA